MQIKTKVNKNDGITLVALVITIIVLLILAGIGTQEGSKTIKKAQLEELKTNMLLIQAKAKEYVETVNFKIGKTTDENEKANIRKEVYEDDAKLKPAGNTITANSSIPVSECYIVTEDTMKQWGLNNIQLANNEYYLIKFDEANTTVEVYNTVGYNDKYSLTDIDNIDE